MYHTNLLVIQQTITKLYYLGVIIDKCNTYYCMGTKNYLYWGTLAALGGFYLCLCPIATVSTPIFDSLL